MRLRGSIGSNGPSDTPRSVRSSWSSCATNHAHDRRVARWRASLTSPSLMPATLSKSSALRLALSSNRPADRPSDQPHRLLLVLCHGRGSLGPRARLYVSQQCDLPHAACESGPPAALAPPVPGSPSSSPLSRANGMNAKLSEGCLCWTERKAPQHRCVAGLFWMVHSLSVQFGPKYALSEPLWSRCS
jgi:hypothetical protein